MEGTNGTGRTDEIDINPLLHYSIALRALIASGRNAAWLAKF